MRVDGPELLGAVPNSVVLMFVRGWQGGTIHQIAAELGITPQQIIDADLDRMQVLMREAQRKLRADMVKYGPQRETA